MTEKKKQREAVCFLVRPLQRSLLIIPESVFHSTEKICTLQIWMMGETKRSTKAFQVCACVRVCARVPCVCFIVSSDSPSVTLHRKGIKST